MTLNNTGLLQHPLSAAFPAIPESDFDGLVEDISKHGLREPVVLHEGMVLDGWHRYRACAKAGKKAKAVEFDGDDPRAFVLSQNLHRRHLTGSQRAMAIVACSNWRPSGVTGGRVAAAATLTNEEMAKAAEVSERTIRDAKVAHTAGLTEKVKSGEVSAERAARIANGKKDKPKVVAASKEIEKLYAQVKGDLIDVQGKYADLTEKHADLADTARELQDKLTAFEATEPDEQQKEIQKLQKKLVRAEAEIDRLTRARNDLQTKCNELIREVKRLRKAK